MGFNTERIFKRWTDIMNDEEESEGRRIAAIKALLSHNFKKYWKDAKKNLEEIENGDTTQAIHAGKILIEMSEKLTKRKGLPMWRDIEVKDGD